MHHLRDGKDDFWILFVSRVWCSTRETVKFYCNSSLCSHSCWLIATFSQWWTWESSSPALFGFSCVEESSQELKHPDLLMSKSTLQNNQRDVETALGPLKQLYCCLKIDLLWAEWNWRRPSPFLFLPPLLSLCLSLSSYPAKIFPYFILYMSWKRKEIRLEFCPQTPRTCMKVTNKIAKSRSFATTKTNIGGITSFRKY